MKLKLLKSISLLVGISILTQAVFAANPNIDGGGGDLGQGTNANGWVVSSPTGGNIFDAEGLRVYLVNSSTGAPVSGSVDITNSNVARTGVFNGRGKTKYEYTNIDGSLNFNTAYQYTRVVTSPKTLPHIIPWDESSNVARIDEIKKWFLDMNYADWVFAQLGTNFDEVSAGGYLLGIEPIAYFRYSGQNYAMTATEVALFDQITNGGLKNRLGPLTHKNLPLAIFLETAEFEGGNRLEPWLGSRTTQASNGDIIRQLGIGFIRYSAASTTAIDTFSYPINTWVVTAFRLCNVRWGGGNWIANSDINLLNPATATIVVNGTTYSIPNIYIPSGSEQLIWIKWKTPSTPQTLTITATSNRGLLYNQHNEGVQNRYVNSIFATVEIYDNDMENEPPDPTLNDTAASIGYSESEAKAVKRSLLSNPNYWASWFVWDCRYDPEADVMRYEKITYTAQIRSNRVQIKPDGRNPTAYTKNYRTFMKSGYGIEVSQYSYLVLTVSYERPGQSTETHHIGSPQTTANVASPQYFFCYFPEFNYSTYFRQIGPYKNDVRGNVFRPNKYSTYGDNNHYTPWWFPDGAEYSLIARSDYAYTPAGKLTSWNEGDYIIIDGNLYDDWRIVPIR